MPRMITPLAGESGLSPRSREIPLGGLCCAPPGAFSERYGFQWGLKDFKRRKEERGWGGCVREGTN